MVFLEDMVRVLEVILNVNSVVDLAMLFRGVSTILIETLMVFECMISLGNQRRLRWLHKCLRVFF